MWTYRPQLDGLRSVAVYLVLLFHAGLPWFTGGFVGVDVFFVLSGFLVTNVILSEVDRTGTLRLGGFYARRVRRLLPAAIAVILATCVVFVLIGSVVRRLPLIADARSALLYFANWHFMGQEGDYFSQELEPSPFLHFWSLSIEEQFYVGFPILLLLLVRRGRRTVLVVLGALFTLSLAAQVIWAQHSVNHAYYGTDARLYQLLAGALLAVVLTRWAFARLARPALWLGAVGLVLVGSGLLDLSPSWRGIAACAASVAIVLGLMQRPEALLSKGLSRPLPVYLGKISYGTYLWHWPVIIAITQLLDIGPWSVAGLAFVLSTALAAVSFHVLETPIRRTPRLNAHRWSVVAVGVATSVAVALAVVGPTLRLDRQPVVAGPTTDRPVAPPVDGVPGASAPVPEGIDWNALLEDNGHALSCAANQVEDCVAVRGSGPTVLLVGDSYANMLFPMFRELARERGFTFASQVLQGCPWPEHLEVAAVNEELERECEAGRVGWYDEALPRLQPDLVVTVMRPPDLYPGTLRRVGDRLERGGSPARTVARTIEETSAKLARLAPRVVHVESVMGTGDLQQPLDCLASARTVGECAVAPEPERTSDRALVAAASSPRVFTADLDPVICPGAPTCLPVLDGEVVWRDRHHLLTTFAVARRDAIWSAIVRSGATRGLT